MRYWGEREEGRGKTVRESGRRSVFLFSAIDFTDSHLNA
jgi:hypothetical protein